MSKLSLPEWRGQIVESILANGLQPGSKLKSNPLCLGSVDFPYEGAVFGALVYPPRKRWIKLDNYKRWYVGANGIFRVLSERHGYNQIRLNSSGLSVEEHRVLEERMGSAFLVVASAKLLMGDVLVDWPALGKIESLESRDFLRLIFPSKIWNGLPSSPITQQFYSQGQVQIIRSNVVRKFGYHLPTHGDTFRLPAFEGAVNRLVRREGPLFVHGVRLPIEEDLNSLF